MPDCVSASLASLGGGLCRFLFALSMAHLISGADVDEQDSN